MLNDVCSTTYTPLVAISTPYTTNFRLGLQWTLRGSLGLQWTLRVGRHNGLLSPDSTKSGPQTLDHPSPEQLDAALHHSASGADDALSLNS